MFVALLPRCGNSCADGAPCNESQVGHTCGGTTCTAFVCDGVQYGPVPKQVGEPCDIEGTTCSTTGSTCGGTALVCQSNVLVDVNTNAVGPGLSCNEKGQSCHYPGTECQSCTCDGAEWVCQMSACCQPGCFEAGTCPSQDDIIAGAPCQSALPCLGAHACGFSSQVFAYCTCSSGTWSCEATCDAGTD